MAEIQKLPDRLKGKQAWREIAFEGFDGLDIDLQPISEQKNEAGETTRKPGFRAVGSIANKRTANRRVYPLEVIKENVERLRQEAKDNRLVGELDHPVDRVSVHGAEAAHKITNITLQQDGKVVIEAEYLMDMPKGKLAYTAQSNFKLGLSSRGAGPMYIRESEDGGWEEVALPGFKFVTWDQVSGPSLGREADIPKILEAYEGGNPVDLKKWMEENPTIVEALQKKFADDPAILAKAAEQIKGSEDFKKIVENAVAKKIEAIQADEEKAEKEAADKAEKEAADKANEGKISPEVQAALNKQTEENKRLADENKRMSETLVALQASTTKAEVESAKARLLASSPYRETIEPKLAGCKTATEVEGMVTLLTEAHKAGAEKATRELQSRPGGYTEQGGDMSFAGINTDTSKDAPVRSIENLACEVADGLRASAGLPALRTVKAG